MLIVLLSKSHFYRTLIDNCFLQRLMKVKFGFNIDSTNYEAAMSLYE